MPDYTHDYFIKVITQRRVNAKKTARPEKTLAKLITSVREKKHEEEGKTMSPAEKLQVMRDNIQAPIRTFELPYQISCVAHVGGEEER